MYGLVRLNIYGLLGCLSNSLCDETFQKHRFSTGYGRVRVVRYDISRINKLF